MLILFLVFIILFHLIKFIVSRKKTPHVQIKLKNLKEFILETDLLTIKSFIAKQIIIFLKIIILGIIIKNWGFFLLGVLAQWEKINPLATFLYNKFTRSQIYDLGHLVLWYGYLFYVLLKIYHWSKRILKEAKRESKLNKKENTHESK